MIKFLVVEIKKGDKYLGDNLVRKNATKKCFQSPIGMIKYRTACSVFIEIFQNSLTTTSHIFVHDKHSINSSCLQNYTQFYRNVLYMSSWKHVIYVKYDSQRKMCHISPATYNTQIKTFTRKKGDIWEFNTTGIIQIIPLTFITENSVNFGQKLKKSILCSGQVRC